MLQRTQQKEARSFNIMLAVSVIAILVHVYLTHLGLSPFQTF